VLAWGPWAAGYGHHSALSPGFPRTALRDSLARMQKSHGTRIECCVSSISAALAVLTDTLASMTKHSCRAFADVALSRDTRS
jgi:hypothetical protein